MHVFLVKPSLAYVGHMVIPPPCTGHATVSRALAPAFLSCLQYTHVCYLCAAHLFLCFGVCLCFLCSLEYITMPKLFPLVFSLSAGRAPRGAHFQDQQPPAPPPYSYMGGRIQSQQQQQMATQHHAMFYPSQQYG